MFLRLLYKDHCTIAEVLESHLDSIREDWFFRLSKVTLGRLDVTPPSMESHRFLNKDIDKVFDDLEQMLEDIDDSNMQQKLKDFKVDIREIVLDVRGIQFANKMFDVLKKDDPNFTKEQYNATVNMGVAMVPVGLANARVSESSLEQVSKAAAALGDIALSKKQQAIITLKRKSAAMLELADLPDLMQKIDADPSVLLKYLDEYEISVVTR